MPTPTQRINTLIEQIDYYGNYTAGVESLEEIKKELNNYLMYPDDFDAVEHEFVKRIEIALNRRLKFILVFRALTVPAAIISTFFLLDSVFTGLMAAYRVGNLDVIIAFFRNLSLSNEGRVFLTACIFIIGFALTVLKSKQQFYYGIVETCIALYICYIFSGNLQSVIDKGSLKFEIFASGVTIVYFVVRGMTNISDAIKDSKKKDAILFKGIFYTWINEWVPSAYKAKY